MIYSGVKVSVGIIFECILFKQTCGQTDGCVKFQFTLLRKYGLTWIELADWKYGFWGWGSGEIHNSFNFSPLVTTLNLLLINLGEQTRHYTVYGWTIKKERNGKKQKRVRTTSANRQTIAIPHLDTTMDNRSMDGSWLQYTFYVTWGSVINSL